MEMLERGPLRPVSDAVSALVTGAVEEYVSTFADDTDQELRVAVRDAVEAVRVHAGETVFREGDEPDAAYFVVTGRLLVSEERDGVDVPLRHMCPGEILGEIGLLEGTRRTATVRATRDTILGRLPAAAFDTLTTRHPQLLREIISVILHRLTHPRPPTDLVRVVSIAVVDPAIDREKLTSELLSEIGRQATVACLSASSVDARLGPGVAQSPRSGADDLRLGEHLDAVEASHRVVVLEADRSVTAWSRRALRHADRVLVVLAADGDPGQRDAAAAFIAAAQTVEQGNRWLVVVHEDGTDYPTSTAALLRECGADRAIHVTRSSKGDIARLARLSTGMGLGLVLGGGGARGFGHLGVYRALHECGIAIDAVGGSSIGAILAAGIARGMPPAELLETAANRFQKVLDYTLPLVSMVKGGRITRQIEHEFGDADIEDLTVPFFCLSTNLTKSTVRVHEGGRLTPALRASSAIPGVIPPVPEDGDLLVDAGVLDNLPVAHMLSTGLVNTVIAVDVAPLLGPRAAEDYGLSVSGWKALRSRVARTPRRLPRITSLLVRSMLVGSMQQRDRIVDAGYADLYLDLDLRGISLLAFDEVHRVARAGYEAALPRIEEWLEATTASG